MSAPYDGEPYNKIVPGITGKNSTGGVDVRPGTTVTGDSGDGAAFNVMPPFTVINYIIKAS